MRRTKRKEIHPVSGYSIALAIHLLSLMLATSAATLTWYAAHRLRRVAEAGEALQWLAFARGVARAFPIATLGLLASGGYMTEARWPWSTPWVIAALVGLAAMVALGAGVEGRRNGALAREIATNGFSARAAGLLCDPLGWSVKFITEALLIAVVLVMVLKPTAEASAALLALAAVIGPIAAVPVWRTRPAAMTLGSAGATEI